MELYSITPLDVKHVDEICQDLIEQQKTGVSTLALMIMYFAPEGMPTVNMAEIYGKKYDLFREKLESAGAKHGALVQSTLGHIGRPNNPHPFQEVISLMEDVVMRPCCPLDEGFRGYIRDQMRELAQHRPGLIMIDDDVGLLYRTCKGCWCPLHQAEFARRIGRRMDRDELITHIRGNSEEDKRITQMYVDMQEDALVGAVQAMREGIDSVDPSIQGAVDTAANFCEATDRMAVAFAGKGNPTIVRFNNGFYTSAGARMLSKSMLRAAMQREIIGDKVDIFLAETDTCPQNRYSTSASTLHSHLTGSILEGAKGAKHWLTRLRAYEPDSGRAYRKILSKYRGFYEELCSLYEHLQPVGCRIPLSKVKDYCLTTPSIFSGNLSGWTVCVLERLGLPVYFSGKAGGAAFLDDNVVWKFTDEEILDFFRNGAFLSAKAARALNERGFLEYTGVQVTEWDKHVSAGAEIARFNGNRMNPQVDLHVLTPVNDKVEALSDVVHILDVDNYEVLFPGVTAFKNPAGGMSYVFSGTQDVPFSYTTAFSFLCETRKKMLISMLKATGNLPVYYPGDMDVYMRAGYLSDGRMLCAMFNLCLDPMEEIELALEKPAGKIELLQPDGTYTEADFKLTDGVTVIHAPLYTLTPQVLIISEKA